MHRSVYRLPGSPASPEQSLLGACLAAGDGAVASHRSAARLWSLRGVEDAPTEITVASPRHLRLPGVVVHSSDRLDPVDRFRRAGIPVTTPARTLLDLGAVVPAYVVEPALEDALMRRLVTFQLLTNTLERLGGSGRRGAAILRALVEERDPATAPTQSMLEDLLFRVVKRGGLPAPVRQYEVAGVRLDGAYPEFRLGAHGWRVLRFTMFDLTRRVPYVLGSIGTQLALAWPA